MWPGGKIPYTYHWSIEEVPKWKDLVDRAIQGIKEVSCLEFQDITAFMENYMEQYQIFRYNNNFFTHYKKEPKKHPDFL